MRNGSTLLAAVLIGLLVWLGIALVVRTAGADYGFLTGLGAGIVSGYGVRRHLSG